MTTISQTDTDRIKLYWAPGCSSCLRTKEFLIKQNIDFESINIVKRPNALEELSANGIRSIPVLMIGDQHTLCQSFGDVLNFLNLPERFVPPLPPEELIAKIDIILSAAAHTTRQIPNAQFKTVFRDRQRTRAELAFHIFRIVEMGLGAAQHKGMAYEDFADTPPEHWSKDNIANWGLSVRDAVLAWWDCQEDRNLKYTIPTYYGNRELHDTIERVTWHAAQHTRQLVLMLEDGGTVAQRPLTAEDLRGLPVPEAVW